MLDKILIANRGEIALRVIRACREMGIRSVAVYSEADRSSRHAGAADEAVCIGPAPALDSYLNTNRILSAAKATGAKAIHPGYGFLAENALFAEKTEAMGLTFIGPKHTAISTLGNKIAARELARRCKVPVVPGTKGKAGRNAASEVSKIGFPVMIKASAGGGGKGLRVVRKKEDLVPTMERASAEAQAAFGDGTLYVEKFVERPRHVEIQLLADKRGNVAAAVERDCTVQRRHQKLIEESPSPAVTPKIRREMQQSAIRLAKACGYSNVGTVEFLLDHDGRFYFMEVNTRLQVEHPVTEMVTGLDLAAEQIRLAAGERLSVTQDRASEIRHHSIEHRINAEDPDNGFAPCPGLVESLDLPGGPGIRIDTHLYAGYTIPSYYDSLLAKLIISAPGRKAAIARSLRALGEIRVGGIKTTTPFHKLVLADGRFASGKFDTHFAEALLEERADAGKRRNGSPDA